MNKKKLQQTITKPPQRFVHFHWVWTS